MPQLSLNPSPTTSEEHEIQEALSRLQRELEKITEEKNTILQKETALLKIIERYKHITAPWRKLNDECLLHIFVCLSEDYGPVTFPLRKQPSLPPQLAISHVCSRWRVVSLSARSIWAKVRLHENFHEKANRRVYLGWLVRASSHPVSLAIDLKDFKLSVSEIFEALSTIRQAVRIRKLNIRINLNYFEAMNRPEFIYWHSIFEDMKLAFILLVNDDEDNDPHLRNLRYNHHFLERASSIAFRGSSLRVPIGNWPWAQLSYLDIQDCKAVTLQEATGILRQMPVVEELYLAFFKQELHNLDEVEKVTLSCLGKLTLRLHDITTLLIDMDDFLRAFECPNLIEFNLFTYHDWSLETYNLLERQYNLKNLEQLDLTSRSLGPCLSMSAILRDAPMLRKLGLAQGVILDDGAIIGIATGTLGRFLSYLWFRGTHNLEEAINMLLSRQQYAHRLISESRNWKENISLFRGIYAHFRTTRRYKKALEDVGIEFKCISSVDRREDPFCPSFLANYMGFDDL